MGDRCLPKSDIVGMEVETFIHGLPICLYRSNCVSGSSTASLISCFCISSPPTSAYVTSGFSSAPSMAMEESASGGKMSTRAFEWR